MGKSTTTLFLFALGLLIVAVLSNENGSEGQLPCSDIHDELDCYDQFEKNGQKFIQRCTWASSTNSSVEAKCALQASETECKSLFECEYAEKACRTKRFCRDFQPKDKAEFPMPSICAFSSKVGYFCTDGIYSCCESMKRPRCACAIGDTSAPTVSPTNKVTLLPTIAPPSATGTPTSAKENDDEDDTSFFVKAVEWIEDNVAITAGAGAGLVLIFVAICVCCRRRGKKQKKRRSMNDRREKYKEASEMFDQVSKRSLAGDELEKYLDYKEKSARAPLPMSERAPLSPLAKSHHLTGVKSRQSPAASTDSQVSVELGAYLNPADRILARPTNSARSILSSSSSSRGISYAYPPGVSQV